MSNKSKNYTPSILFDSMPDAEEAVKVETAVVYCEAQFGEIGGKIANGLIRHSKKYKIVAVIDSERHGEDSGKVLEGTPNGIPIFRDLGTALAQGGRKPDNLIFGVAPEGGVLSVPQRRMLLRAISYGINIVSGVPEFLNADPEFAAALEAKANVKIDDVRQPGEEKDMSVFSGRISEVTCPRIAVLGTDDSVGKRTTATVIANTLSGRGIKTVVIGTGPTSLMQGNRYGLAIDAIPAKYRAGELEAKIVEAFENEDPDVILIKGQGALSQAEDSISSYILQGSCPQAVILQHAPARKFCCEQEDVPMPEPKSEIALIEKAADTKVIGMTLSHEGMTEEEVSIAMRTLTEELEIPVTDALTKSPQKLIDMVRDAFPEV